MRISLLAVAVIGSLLAASCSNEHPAAHSSIASQRADTGQRSSLPQHASQIASLPDRGVFARYDRTQAPLRSGAYTAYPVQLSEEHALAAIAAGGMVVDAPDGHPIRLQYKGRIEHADGNWTWVGRVAGASPGSEALLTFGEKAVFGTIPDGQRAPLELTTQGGRTWMVATDQSRLVTQATSAAASAAAMANDALAAPAAAGAAHTGAAAPKPSAAGIQVAAAGSTTATPATVVDLVIGYTSAFASRLGGASQALTRLNFIVDIANQGYSNSGVAGRIRLVHAMQVDYADDTENRATLLDLSGLQCTNATGVGQLQLPNDNVNCTRVATSAALRPLLRAREQYRADLVSLVRVFHSPSNQSCGVAWLIGGAQRPISADNAAYGLSVISDSSGAQFPDNGSTCRNETLAHELGHNMGLAHDRATASLGNDTNGDGNNLDPEEYGRFPYSFGYSTGSSAGNFYTIMSVPVLGQTSYRVFSNPRITTCGGLPCGVANQSDNALALQQTMPLVAQFRTSTVARISGDFNGDGKADILWHNTLSGRGTIFLSGNIATQQPVATVSDLSWTIVGVADFNGDHRSDILWRNTKSGRNAIWLSGNNATQIATAAVTTQTWTVAGTGDFNGDGKGDILWHNTSDGRNTIWLSGNNASQQAVDQVRDQTWFIAGIGDFNGDGKADIVWRNTVSGRNTIWLGGINATQQAVASVASQDWEIRGTGDFNGDGKADLLWRNRMDGSGSVWLGGNNATQQAVTTITDFAWQIVGFGDFNGDHSADLVWRNDTDGRNAIWLSANNSTQQAIASIASQTWVVAP